MIFFDTECKDKVFIEFIIQICTHLAQMWCDPFLLFLSLRLVTRSINWVRKLNYMSNRSTKEKRKFNDSITHCWKRAIHCSYWFRRMSLSTAKQKLSKAVFSFPNTKCALARTFVHTCACARVYFEHKNLDSIIKLFIANLFRSKSWIYISVLTNNVITVKCKYIVTHSQIRFYSLRTFTTTCTTNYTLTVVCST